MPAADVAPGLATDAGKLIEREKLVGPQATQDTRTYKVWHKMDNIGGPPGKYFVDDAGKAVYLVDPGINGAHTTRPDGSEVRKYDAPKAVLMSYIIKGILDRQLPWALVLFGVMIAVVLEMCGVPSLAFAVGVYLPLSSSAPIFIGGLLRRITDWKNNQRPENAGLSPIELVAANDRGPGVLLAAGYIAGGALAGIVIAFSAGVLTNFDKAVSEWAAKYNPFFGGPSADALSLLPYGLLVALLYIAGRRRLNN